MRVSFVGEAVALGRLREALVGEGVLTDVREIAGTPAEVERLGFDLGDVLTVVGALGTAIEAVKFAKFVVEALSQSKVKKLEIIGPNGRALIDVEGKSDEDVAMDVRKALPFLR